MNIIILIIMLMNCSNQNLKLENKICKCCRNQQQLGDRLLLAASNRDQELVTQLLSSGADVNYANASGWTALMETVNKDQEKIEDEILSTKSRVVTAQLLSSGANVNIATQHGETALILAVRSRDEEIISQLLSSGANVNHKDKDGKTALIYSVSKQQEEPLSEVLLAKAIVTIKQLLVSGANVNLPDKNGKRALMYAAENGNLLITMHFIAAGANVNETDKYGMTALMYAAANGNEEVVEHLLELVTDVNQIDEYGCTALMYAAENGNEEVIVQLLEGGSDAHYPDEDGCTALIYAAKYNKLLPFMKAYARSKFNLPRNAPDNVVINGAFMLLLLDRNAFVNQQENIDIITIKHMNEFLLHPQIDLSGMFEHTVYNTKISINSIQTIYKKLLIDVFDQINTNDLKYEMLDVINKWDIATKRKMLRAIFVNNKDKINIILTNTIRQDRKANQKRETLKEMVRLLLVDGIYNREFKIKKEQIWKVFQDELDKDFIIGLHNKGWR